MEQGVWTATLSKIQGFFIQSALYRIFGGTKIKAIKEWQLAVKMPVHAFMMYFQQENFCTCFSNSLRHNHIHLFEKELFRKTKQILKVTGDTSPPLCTHCKQKVSTGNLP